MSIRPEDVTSWWPWDDPWPPNDWRSRRRVALYKAVRQVQEEHGPIVSESRQTENVFAPNGAEGSWMLLIVDYQDGFRTEWKIRFDAPEERRGWWTQTFSGFP